MVNNIYTKLKNLNLLQTMISYFEQHENAADDWKQHKTNRTSIDGDFVELIFGKNNKKNQKIQFISIENSNVSFHFGMVDWNGHHSWIIWKVYKTIIWYHYGNHTFGVHTFTLSEFYPQDFQQINQFKIIFFSSLSVRNQIKFTYTHFCGFF